MHRIFGRFVSLASGRLLIANLVLLVALKVLVPLGANNLADITSTDTPPDTAAVIADTNDARHGAGLGSLARNATLDKAAQARLDDMAQKGYFAHQSPDGRMPWDFIATAGYHYKSAGENLARGFSDANAVVQAWLASPAHRANILNTTYRDIGIAASSIMLNGHPAIVVVELYGTPTTKAVVPAKPVAKPVADSRISTEPAIASVPAPITPVVEGASISTGLSGYVTIWISAILGILTLAVGWIGAQRRLVYAWSANLAILALLVLVPSVSTTLGRIF